MCSNGLASHDYINVSGELFFKTMMRIPKVEDMQYDHIKQKYKDEEDFVERLQNSIWPNTDVDTFVALLDEGGKDCLEMRYGKRKETCLHRYLF